jgi:hypothetical protein
VPVAPSMMCMRGLALGPVPSEHAPRTLAITPRPPETPSRSGFHAARTFLLSSLITRRGPRDYPRHTALSVTRRPMWAAELARTIAITSGGLSRPVTKTAFYCLGSRVLNTAAHCSAP